jgi:predicted RNA-binding protein with PUA-like domain
MAYWLLKTEPEEFSYDDLVREGKTVWDGVTNNWALKFIRSIRRGDLAFIYHSGKEKRIAGIARVISDPYPDPQKNNPALQVFQVESWQALQGRVTLKYLKNDPAFSEFLLVKFSRLSVMPLSEKYWQQILQLDRSSDFMAE